eukprot:g867.t1
MAAALEESIWAKRTLNPIRKIVDEIKQPEQLKDKPTIVLALGDPSKFGNLPPPERLVAAVASKATALSANGYVHSAGIPETRKAIAREYSTAASPLTSDDVVVASGCSGALELAYKSLLNPGDTILLPSPGFALYETIARHYQVSCAFYPLIAEKGWEADIAKLRDLAASTSAKVLLINNPSNPCGSVYSKEHLEELVSVARDHGMVIIADEIYGNVVFDESKTFFPVADVAPDVPVLATGGAAKEFLVPGWRLGWVIVHDRPRGKGVLANVRTGLLKLSQVIIGANTLVQAALATLLEDTEEARAEMAAFRKRTLDELRANAEVTTSSLREIPGLHVFTPPAGAMYVMVGVEIAKLPGIVDDVQFAQALLDEERVFVLPGSCFGMARTGDIVYFRVVIAAPKEKLVQAYARMRNFLESKASKRQRLE